MFHPQILGFIFRRSPLLWLTWTLVVWILVSAISTRLGNHSFTNPVLLFVVIIACLLSFTRVSYSTYFDGAQFIHFLLGPATVVLAVPLVRQIKLVTSNILPMVAALAGGSVTAVGTVVILGHFMALPQEMIISMALKSSTAGLCAISSRLGGDPGLTAMLVI
jgi:putative effector of murein hydrolase